MAVILRSANRSYCICLHVLHFVKGIWVGISLGKDAILCHLRIDYCISI